MIKYLSQLLLKYFHLHGLSLLYMKFSGQYVGGRNRRQFQGFCSNILGAQCNFGHNSPVRAGNIPFNRVGEKLCFVHFALDLAGLERGVYNLWLFAGFLYIASRTHGLFLLGILYCQKGVNSFVYAFSPPGPKSFYGGWVWIKATASTLCIRKEKCLHDLPTCAFRKIAKFQLLLSQPPPPHTHSHTQEKKKKRKKFSWSLKI